MAVYCNALRCVAVCAGYWWWCARGCSVCWVLVVVCSWHVSVFIVGECEYVFVRLSVYFPLMKDVCVSILERDSESICTSVYRCVCVCVCVYSKCKCV